MKIYQIHEYGGDWEDSYDYIVGSYLSKDKATTEKERLEKEEKFKQELVVKCDYCPLYDCFNECDGNCPECLKRRGNKAKEYCEKYKPDAESYECKNRVYFEDNSYFKIEEVDVTE